MPHSYNFASSEFNLLCQSQIKLLTQALGALWSAVYLTDSSVNNGETNLFPFMIYPQTEEEIYQKLPGIEVPEIWQEVISKPVNDKIKLKGSALSDQSTLDSNFLLPDKITEEDISNKIKNLENIDNKQLVLPLIHETNVMGLLIIVREDRNWEREELEQAESIAQTLAIARFMELQTRWYQRQLELQQETNHWQKDRLDDLFHQLRNPLTALKTFSKLLIKRLLPGDKNQSFAESMLRESERLSGLLEQFETEVKTVSVDSVPEEAPSPQILPIKDGASVILSTSPVLLPETESSERNNFLLPDKKKDLEKVDLKEILTPLLLTAEAIAIEKSIKLKIDIKDDIPLVKGNAAALREVFNNLIDNAIKYTPSEGTIKIAIKIQDNLVGVSIQDTGYGIPQEVQSQIFQRHYRGIQAEGDIPGTGLGLAIANELIKQMAGNIELISPNKLRQNSNFPGTTFIVWMRQIQLN